MMEQLIARYERYQKLVTDRDVLMDEQTRVSSVIRKQRVRLLNAKIREFREPLLISVQEHLTMYVKRYSMQLLWTRYRSILGHRSILSKLRNENKAGRVTKLVVYRKANDLRVLEDRLMRDVIQSLRIINNRIKEESGKQASDCGSQGSEHAEGQDGSSGF